MITQTNINKLVSRIDDEYYICEYLFKNTEDFKGATALILSPVSRAEYEERTDPESEVAIERFEECWREQVRAGVTTHSLKEYVEEILAVDGDEAVFDMGGYEYWDMLRKAEPELTEEDYPIFECVGCGRSFSKEMQFDKIYNEKLWQQIKEIES